MKRKVKVTFEIVADKMDNDGLRKILELEISRIAPTLISNIKVQVNHEQV